MLNPNDPMYIAFDIESGGIDPDETDMLSVYFAVLNENLEQLAELDLLVKPDNGVYRVTAQALDINKINLIEHDKVALTASKAGQTLFEFLRTQSQDKKIKLIPLGHNVHFDIDGIQTNLLNKKAWGQFTSYRVMDTQIIARYLQMKGVIPRDLSVSLGSLCKYFNIEYGNHTAKGDTLSTVNVMRQLLRL